MADPIYRVGSDGDGTLIAVGSNGLILRSTDDGGSWTQIVTGVTKHLYGVAYGAPLGYNQWVIVGQDGTVLTSPTGSSWVLRTPPVATDLYDVAYGGAFTAVGENGVMAVSDDLGYSWLLVSSGTLEDLYSITFDLANYLIVGANDTIITGQIGSLDMSPEIRETLEFTGENAVTGTFSAGVTERLDIVSGAGRALDSEDPFETYITEYEWITENLTVFDPIPMPGGTFGVHVIEELDFLGGGPVVLQTVHGPGLSLPALRLQGTMLHGSVFSGNLRMPALAVAGTFSRPWGGNLRMPAMRFSGTVAEAVVITGNLRLPGLRMSGLFAEPKPFLTSANVAWVVNSVTKAHSTYTNWNVNSYVRFNGKDMVATSVGIFELTPGADGATAVTGKVYWPPSAFGTDKQQRIEAAYVRLRGSAQPFLLVATCDEQERRIYTASMTGFPAGVHPKRVLFTRNLRGNLWQIGFENTSGGDFDLVEIEVVTIPDPHRRLK